MLQLILLLINFSGLIFLLCRFGKVPFSIAPALIVSGLIGILFCSDFAGSLALATYLFYIIGWSASFYFLYSIINKSRLSPHEDNKILIGFSLIAFFWFYKLNLDGAYSAWDEFSHWGSIVKAIYGANTFHFDRNPLYFEDYPPGTALFTYYVLKLLGYSEGAAYFSNSLILLAFLLPISGLIVKRGLFWVLSYGIIALLLVIILGHGLFTLLVDHIVSVIFSGTVAAYFLLRRSKSDLWPLTFMLIALNLTKHIGQSLSLLIVCICIVDLTISKLIYKKNFRINYFTFKHITQISYNLAILVIPMSLINFIWKQYVITNGLNQSFSQLSIFELFLKSRECCILERDVKIVTGFVDNFLGLPLYDQTSKASNLILIAWNHLMLRFPSEIFHIKFNSSINIIIFLTLAGLFSSYLTKNFRDRLRLLALVCMFFVGAIGFNITLLLFYLYGISDYEGRIIASFTRFERTYLLAWALGTMVSFAFAFGTKPRILNKKKYKTSSTLTIILLLLIPLFLLDSQTLRQLHIKADPIGEERAKIREWILPEIKKVPLMSRVYIVWEGTSGIEFWYIKHEFLPRQTNKYCFSLGPPQFSGDIWSCPLSEHELSKTLKDYQFLIVGHGLDRLKTIYPSLLRNVPNDLERGVLKISQSNSPDMLSITFIREIL